MNLNQTGLAIPLNIRVFAAISPRSIEASTRTIDMIPENSFNRYLLCFRVIIAVMYRGCKTIVVSFSLAFVYYGDRY